jgi:hypothetical protein
VNDFRLIIKPDETDAEAATLFVEGTVGSHRYQFLLDTGAGRSSVAFDAHTGGYGVVGSHASAGVFARSTEDLITVPRIEVGPMTQLDFTLVRSPQHLPVRSAIGMDFLHDHCYHFLIDERRVEVDPPDAAGRMASLQELRVDRRFHPYIDVAFGTTKANAVWDTGAGITVVDLNFIRDQAACFEEVGRSQGTDATGQSMETTMFIATNMMIAGNVFSPHRVAGVDLAPVNATIETPMELILGYSTIRQANWLFDFPGRRWAVTKLHPNGSDQ